MRVYRSKYAGRDGIKHIGSQHIQIRRSRKSINKTNTTLRGNKAHLAKPFTRVQLVERLRRWSQAQGEVGLFDA